MSFDSWAAFWHMGGHHVYVWSSFGITFAVLGAMIWLPLRRQRRLLADVRRRVRIEAAADGRANVPVAGSGSNRSSSV